MVSELTLEFYVWNFAYLGNSGCVHNQSCNCVSVFYRKISCDECGVAHQHIKLTNFNPVPPIFSSPCTIAPPPHQIRTFISREIRALCDFTVTCRTITVSRRFEERIMEIGHIVLHSFDLKFV